MNRPIARIMIVDQHHIVRRGIRALIESKPCIEVVGEAADGLEAIDVARRTIPDIAILALSLPKRNGLSVLRLLKMHFPRTRVLIFTFHDEEALIAQVLRAGARGFVLKSEPEEHLLDALYALSLGRSYFSSAVSESLLERSAHSYPDKCDSSLSHREKEVVQLVAEGYISKQVAECLDISIKTVESHRAHAMRKLNLRTMAELVRYAVRNNIVRA